MYGIMSSLLCRRQMSTILCKILCWCHTIGLILDLISLVSKYPTIVTGDNKINNYILKLMANNIRSLGDKDY